MQEVSPMQLLITLILILLIFLFVVKLIIKWIKHL